MLLDVTDSQFSSQINGAYLPVWVDRAGVDDPLIRDFAGEIRDVASVHLAKIVGDNPKILNNRSELRAELLKRLAIFEGFESIITDGQRWGQFGFGISGTLAKAFLQHRSELRLAQSA